MHVQVQENGSYRSSDVVEALAWMLPDAADSSESVVVLLDWYSGHLTEEVAALVKSKGHVLLFHGGGCTPFSQINDTHLHAMLARVLIEIENAWALEERQRLLDLGLNKTPTMTREEILSIVATAWLSINHERVAAKGYKQTGPTMPLRGPVAPEDVFGDLLRVMEELDPSATPTEVGMTLRDEAVAFVKDGFDAGKWTRWSDCEKLIEEHDGLDEAAAEGLEAFGAIPEASDDEEGDDSDADDEASSGGAAGGLSAKPSDADSQEGDESETSDADGDGGTDGPSGGSGCLSAKPSDGPMAPTHDGGIATVAVSNAPIEIAAARQVLYDEAVRKRDDLMLKHMRKQMRQETQTQKDASTEVAVLLRKRGQEYREAEAKRRRDSLAEEKLAAKDLEETMVIRAKAQQAAAEARLASLRQIVLKRRDARLGNMQRLWREPSSGGCKPSTLQCLGTVAFSIFEVCPLMPRRVSGGKSAYW